MPDYLILLATLGGLALFGISGMVIGPLIAALFITLWEMFEQSYGDRDLELLRDELLVSQNVATTNSEAASDPEVEDDEPPSATS